MRSCLLLFIIWYFILVIGCLDGPDYNVSEDEKNLELLLDEESVLIKDPLTPADVFQNWQIYMDQNRFDEAARWSTEETRDWIRTIQAIVDAADAEKLTQPTRIEGIRCRETGDTAICLFAEEVGDELHLDSIRLIRLENQWNVDLWTEEERSTSK